MNFRIPIMMTMTRWWYCALVLASALALHAQEEFPINQLDQPPSPKRQFPPTYPYVMRAAGLEGRVSVNFIVNYEGKVVEAHVQRSNNPWFERPALDAIMRWTFTPGKKNGRPVNTRCEIDIPFTLEGGGETFWQVKKQKNPESMPPEYRWDIAPEPVNTMFPVYPFEDLVQEKEGKTQIAFVIGRDGYVISSRVLQATTPEMGQAALAMIDAWEFKPARKKDGTPAYAAVGLTHSFGLRSGDVPVSDSAHGILRALKKEPKSIATLAELDQPLRPLSRRAPVYPSALRKKGADGSAEIEFFIDRSGDAQLPRIVSSTAPEFGYAAVQAVATWRYTVPKKAGKAVVARASITVNFKLGEEAAPAGKK